MALWCQWDEERASEKRVFADRQNKLKSDALKSNNGKKALFESWGYDIMDSTWLQNELIRQAREKYANGDFILGKLDKYGQRISIEIALPRKKSGSVSFVTGWLVYPDGVIINTTPYGDK